MVSSIARGCWYCRVWNVIQYLPKVSTEEEVNTRKLVASAKVTLNLYSHAVRPGLPRNLCSSWRGQLFAQTFLLSISASSLHQPRINLDHPPPAHTTSQVSPSLHSPPSFHLMNRCRPYHTNELLLRASVVIDRDAKSLAE